MFAQEIEYHVAPTTVERGVHGHLSQEIFASWIDDRQGSEAIPQVIERKNRLGVLTHVLIVDRNKRTTELHGVGRIVVHKLIGEMEHVGHGHLRLPVVVDLPIIAEKIAVTTDDFLGLRVPNDELSAPIVHGVELVDVCRLSRSSTSCSESNLSEPSYLLHHVGRVLGRNHINLVVALVCCPQFTLMGQLSLEQILADWLTNLFFHHNLLYGLTRLFPRQAQLVRIPYLLQIWPIPSVFGSCRTFARVWAYLPPHGSFSPRSHTSRRRGRAWPG